MVSMLFYRINKVFAELVLLYNWEIVQGSLLIRKGEKLEYLVIVFLLLQELRMSNNII